jgi:signal transduction histidine kinase/CheY-like chemotaxis protein
MLDQVFEALREPVVVFDLEAHPVAVNAAAYTLVGIPAHMVDAAGYIELLTRLRARTPDDVPIRVEDLPSRRILAGEPFARATVLLTRPDGVDLYLDVTASPVLQNGALAGAVIVLRDMTEARRTESRLERLICALRAHSHTDSAALRASDENAYLSDVCRIIVEDCGHPMAWIGIAEHDAARSVRPVAHAGFDQGYLEQLDVTWADTERGRGPTGIAIRTGEWSYCPNMLTDPEFGPWREQAIRRGYASSIAFPLSIGGEVFGALAIYFKQPDALTTEEIGLLTELARDIADGVRVLRLRQAENRAREVLRRQAEELARADRMKDEFLATLSHELRTPLSTILVWSHLLVKGHLDEPARRRAEEAIYRNAEAQSQLISDLLDVSRIISGKLKLSVRDVELHQVLAAALDVVRPAAEAKHLALNLSVQPVSAVAGDPGRLQQVLWNLLSNAVKFTPEGGKVLVELRDDGRQVLLRVSDTGIGIAPEFLPHIFERFAQEDSSASRQYGGLGLGLAIVRHLVELHGGAVAAESEGAGCGAAFLVKLPVSRPSGAARDLQAEAAAKPAQQSGVGVPGDAALAGRRILAVDDDADARELFATVLGRLGADVVVAASAEEAMERLRADRYDILLADIGMPATDGYALVEAVRLLPGDVGRIPAIAVSAFGRREDKARALAAGYNAHLSKPILPDQLAAAIARFIQRYSPER